jgi:hypothetical protein
MFNRGIARVQKELVNNGNGRAVFAVDKITVFAVNVTNSNGRSVSAGTGDGHKSILYIKDLILSDKSLKILAFCVDNPQTKKELLLKVGVTTQTINVRSIINPLISAECLAPLDEDRDKVRNVRYCATARGIECLRYHATHPAGGTDLYIK